MNRRKGRRRRARHRLESFCYIKKFGGPARMDLSITQPRHPEFYDDRPSEIVEDAIPPEVLDGPLQ